MPFSQCLYDQPEVPISALATISTSVTRTRRPGSSRRPQRQIPRVARDDTGGCVIVIPRPVQVQSLLRLDRDRVPASGAVRLRKSEVLRLQRARAVDSARHQLHVLANRKRELALPVHPDVVAWQALEQPRRLPGIAAVTAVLHGADAAIARVGNAGYALWAGRQPRIAVRDVNARHRLDERLAAPVALAVPVDELTRHRPQGNHPFGVFHAVSTGDQDPRRV